MERIIRRSALLIAAPLIRRMSQAHRPSTVVSERFAELDLRVGDVILTRTKWSLANLVVPGHYKHCMMYVGADTCVEAVLPSVRRVSTQIVAGSVDEYCVLRARFAMYTQAGSAAVEISKLVGLPYDLYFEPGKTAFYCSEAVRYAYMRATPKWEFEQRMRMGVRTATPQDFYDCGDFKVVYEHRK